MAHALEARPSSPTRARGRVRWPAPTLEHVWVSIALVIAALGSGLFPIESIDYWWTIKLGDLIRRNGALLTSEPLIYTPVREVTVDGQWLARVILSAVHEAGGVELSLTLRSIITVAVAGLLLGLCRDAGAGVRSSAGVICLVALLYLPGLAVRPQMFAVVPFLIVLRAALTPPTGFLAGAVVVAAVVVWANVHGSFVLAYPLLAIGLLDAARRQLGGERGRLRPLLLLVLACAVAPLANPNGLGLVTYVWDTVLFNGGATSVGTLAAEWWPPTLRTAYGRAFMLSLLGVVLIVGAGRRPRFAEGLLLLLFGLLALSAVRHILWWTLVMTPFAARALGLVLADVAARLRQWRAPLGDASRVGAVSAAGPSSRSATGVPLANALILVLFALVAVACLPWYRTRLPLPVARTALIDQATPIAVAEYLAANPGPGELFHSTDWGGYFGWRLGPERKLFIDDRFELHPAEVWRDYMTLTQGHATWERLLDQYGVGQLALDREAQSALVEAVAESPNWTLAYDDERAVVYERRDRVGAIGAALPGDGSAGAGVAGDISPDDE